MNKEYISMAQATEICTYDQEYLSLLARRGLLQAEKIGKKWYTTREWLNNYLQKNRPNEIIRNKQEISQKADKFFKNPKIFKQLLIGIGMISLIVTFSYIIHRLNQLEQQAAKNAYIFNEMEKTPKADGT
jgi:hypothetical protein